MELQFQNSETDLDPHERKKLKKLKAMYVYVFAVGKKKYESLATIEKFFSTNTSHIEDILRCSLFGGH